MHVVRLYQRFATDYFNTLIHVDVAIGPTGDLIRLNFGWRFVINGAG
jgi:hypothetical protein